MARGGGTPGWDSVQGGVGVQLARLGVAGVTGWACRRGAWGWGREHARGALGGAGYRVVHPTSGR